MALANPWPYPMPPTNPPARPYPPGWPHNPDWPNPATDWERHHHGSNINPKIKLDPSTTSVAPIPDLPDVENFTANDLQEHASYWRDLAQSRVEVLGSIKNDADNIPWTGVGHQAMLTAIGRHYTVANSEADELRAAARTADDGAEQLTRLQRTIISTVQQAQQQKFHVTPSWQVVDTATDPMQQLMRQPVAQAIAADLAQQVSMFMATQTHIAADLSTHASKLAGVSALDVKTDKPGAPPSIPDDSKQFTDFWNKLTPQQKEQLYNKDHSIGNHPGMPWADANTYNRRYLPELIQQGESQKRDMQHTIDDMLQSRGADDGQIYSMQTQIASIDSHLNGYKAVQNDLNKTKTDGLPRYLARIDQFGHAAVSIGNPDTAGHNAVLVPGTGQDVAAIDRSDGKAVEMYHAADTLRPGDVSVTTWMGYDRPMNLIAADDPSRAVAGAAGLDQFMDSMRASHQTGASINTVIGHSYGSTEVGAAASSGHHLDADNVIVVGSPGMLVDHASDLQLAPQGKFYFMHADNDPVSGAATAITPLQLGAPPDAVDFGGTELSASPGPGNGLWPDAAAHSFYWNDPIALDNMGAIIAGNPPLYTPKSP